MEGKVTGGIEERMLTFDPVSIEYTVRYVCSAWLYFARNEVDLVTFFFEGVVDEH
jgi:uncharacterized membrane protein YjdF